MCSLIHRHPSALNGPLTPHRARQHSLSKNADPPRCDTAWRQRRCRGVAPPPANARAVECPRPAPGTPAGCPLRRERRVGTPLAQFVAGGCLFHVEYRSAADEIVRAAPCSLANAAAHHRGPPMRPTAWPSQGAPVQGSIGGRTRGSRHADSFNPRCPATQT